MSSDHFPLNFIYDCDDDGVYYMRQIGPEDGVDGFEGLVWFGQQLQDEPAFANVFVGRLRHGVDTDACGHRVDRWEGRFIDVPKGRACGAADLTIRSFTVDARETAACEFLEHYLIKDNRAPFGGRVWPLPVSYCWQSARCAPPFDPPPFPPRVARALAGDFSIRDDIARLTSNLVTAGFERSGDDITGTWRGDDGGSYYVTQVPGSNEVAWYAEHSTARPLVPMRPPQPAQGWANVFLGERSGRRMMGMWADVPRGSANSAGHLQLVVTSPRLMRIVRATGGYGGRTLWRVKTRKVTVRVESLAVDRAEESSGDEPLLYLTFFKIDGETANLDDLRSSSATVASRPEVMLGNDIRGPVMVPLDIGQWETTLSTLRSDSGGDVEAATRIGVIAYAIEVDDGYSREFREQRFSTWSEGREWAINSALRRGEIPSLEFLRSNANRILVRYLGPWEGWPWGNPDDALSGDVAMVSFADIVRDGRIERTLTFSGEGARYSARVVFQPESRINARCSS